MILDNLDKIKDHVIELEAIKQAAKDFCDSVSANDMRIVIECKCEGKCAVIRHKRKTQAFLNLINLQELV